MKKLNNLLCKVCRFLFGGTPKEDKPEYYINYKGDVKEIKRVTTE